MYNEETHSAKQKMQEDVSMVRSEEKVHFYKRVMLIALPIMVQNGITNFVSMLDNIMVGRVGTDPMSAVAIVNQLLFVWNLCIFGGLSGIGIFTAQYAGKEDEEGIRHTFRLQLALTGILFVLGLLVFIFFDTGLISLYLKGTSGSGDPVETLRFGKEYLKVMLFGLLPFALTQVYSTTLRSKGETVVPMAASVVAVAVNLVGNYILIFGKLGSPAFGVVGAAIATVLSRFVEMGILIIWTHTHKEKHPFIRGAYRSLRVPAPLLISCIKKGSPLLLNEALWAGGLAVLNQIYSRRGLDVVAANNISSTISNVGNVAFLAMGVAIGIVLGQELGKGHFSTVRRDAERLSLFSVLICLLFGGLLFAVSGLFPSIYNTSEEVRRIATGLIRISALCMPIYAYGNATYFTLRSGGRTVITFLFDSCFVWIISIPTAFLLVTYTDFDILKVFLFVQLVDLIKCVIGFIMVRKEIWIRDITKL